MGQVLGSSPVRVVALVSAASTARLMADQDWQVMDDDVVLLQQNLALYLVNLSERDGEYASSEPLPEILAQTSPMLTSASLSYGDRLREGLLKPQARTFIFDKDKYSLVAQAAKASSLKRLYWLHIPKTGTSFVATVWNYACGQHAIPLDLNVDAHARPGCLECYDFALMDRYPKDKYSSLGVLSPIFQTQHRPTSLAEIHGGENVVSLFRRPNQRLISAFHARHASGFSRPTFQGLLQKCNDASCFANYPGIAGCMTRMLTGGFCADEVNHGENLQQRADEAVSAVKHLSFVGLTEAWDESVCLFHVMFGGRVNHAEFKDIHLSRQQDVDYDESQLMGFVDEADEKVYAAAKARHSELLRQHVGDSTSACEYLAGSKASLTSVLQDLSGNISVSSCAAAEAECGLIDQLDCGSCPPGRLLPERESFLGRLFNRAAHLKCSPAGKCLVNGKHIGNKFSWYV